MKKGLADLGFSVERVGKVWILKLNGVPVGKASTKRGALKLAEEF